jgi:hypothetical protein
VQVFIPLVWGLPMGLEVLPPPCRPPSRLSLCSFCFPLLLPVFSFLGGCWFPLWRLPSLLGVNRVGRVCLVVRFLTIGVCICCSFSNLIPLIKAHRIVQKHVRNLINKEKKEVKQRSCS